jgi:transposase
MLATTGQTISVVGIDIGKNSFHLIGLDDRGAIVLRQKWSRGQVQTRLANLPPCLIGMEACVGAHHLAASAAGTRSGTRRPTMMHPKHLERRTQGALS